MPGTVIDIDIDPDLEGIEKLPLPFATSRPADPRSSVSESVILYPDDDVETNAARVSFARRLAVDGCDELEPHPVARSATAARLGTRTRARRIALHTLAG
jgi:hypothetical protein